MTSPFDDKPLAKLTDFRLAHKFDPDDPRLSTRCGSRLYAVPELLVAAHTIADAELPLPSLWRARSIPTVSPTPHLHLHPCRWVPRPRGRSRAHGRGMIASVFGVALFAHVTRALPFDPLLILDTPSVDADSGRARADTGASAWCAGSGPGLPPCASRENG